MARVTAPVLDIYGPSLTDYKATAATPIQNLRPRFDQRGVDIDGTLKLPSPLGWAIAADPLGGGTAAGRTLGDLNLFTGTYNPTDVDLAFPSLGLPVVIGRTYNHVSLNSSNALFNCGGVVGINWATTTQPELRLFEGATDDLDVLYLVYGADRYIEFKRFGTTGDDFNTFKAKNGAAGVIYFTPPDMPQPGTYTYYDQRGNAIDFFGFDGYASPAEGQLWHMTDPMGKVAYIGNDTTATAAISAGYTASGRTKLFYDASGRRYTFTYATFGSVADLLSTVVVEINSGSWTEIGRVAYDYYTSTDTTNDRGLAGDLKTVTVTLEMGATDYVRTKYYRYYTRAWSNSDGRRGEAHWLKMVVGFDGIRQFGSTYNDSGTTEAALKPYTESFFEYASGDSRIWKVTFNGNCGCAGGSSGTFALTYENTANTPTYATQIANTSYDTGWGKRTIVEQPDAMFVTQHFDETGAVLGRVITNLVPSGSYTKKWITDVTRNSSGQVTSIHSPENITGYTHSTGAITRSTSAGLVTTYTRWSTSSNLDGLCYQNRVQPGTSGSLTTIREISLSEVQLSVGSSGVSVPTVASSTNPVDSGVTSFTYTYWSATSTSPEFIAPKIIQTASPAVDTGKNGSGSAVSTYRYLRKDGSTAYTKNADSVLMYSGRSTFGQSEKQIADYYPTTGGYLTGDDHSQWSLSSSGTPIHAITTMAYDNQGRLTTTTRPSAGPAGTRVSINAYVLDGAQLGTLSFPRFTGGTTYIGPAAYTRVNHAGRPDRRAAIQHAASTSLPSLTPSSTYWSAWVDTVHDLSGMRPTESRTYTNVTGPVYDAALTGYDSMGRVARTVDATGTITRTKYDERGMVIERWIGLNDNTGWSDPAGSGSGSDMVKVEVLEYDDNASGGGKNGWLSDRVQDADGSWGGAGDQRRTEIQYDFRGRAIVQINPAAPHSVAKYDNLNRVIASGQYSYATGLTASTDPTSTATAGGGASIRVALSESAYDERGQVWQSIRWYVDPSDGTKGSGLYTHNWYDAAMRPVKSLSAQATKTLYDRLGRPQDRFVLYSNNASTYADALTVTGDNVLEQHHTGYHAATGAALLQYTVQRKHDDSTTTGALCTDTDPMVATSTSVYGRSQITAMWYDDWDRVENVARYGTNGGSTFTRTSLSVPSRSDTILVTTNTYDLFGRVYEVSDPAGVESRTVYDFAGRREKTIDNYVDGTPSAADDRTLVYTYTSGLVTSVTRDLPADDQTTTYAYDTTFSSSQITALNMLTRVVYPEQTISQAATDRDVVTKYNALSQPLTVTDPAGNVVTMTYDNGGRVTSRVAYPIQSPFDTRVKSILTTYNPRGMVESVWQQDENDVILDETAYEYDGLGNLVTLTQDPDSEIGVSGRDEFVTTNTYGFYSAASSYRGVSLAGITMPFGTSSSADEVVITNDDIGRVKTVETGTYQVIADYMYMGAGTVVGFDGPFADNHLYKAGGSGDYNDYMDRFNRAIQNVWTGGSGDVDFIEMTATHNRYGQITTVKDLVLKDDITPPNRNFDALISYDGLRRAYAKEEGELNTGLIAISTRSRIENFPRLASGRIDQDQVSVNSDSDYVDGPEASVDAGEMDDTRTYNKRNELRSRSVYDKDNPSTPMTVTLAYDLNGNLTDDGEKYAYKYDVWGRVVEIKNRTTSDLQAVYTSNGLGQRISEQLDTNDSGGSGKPDGEVDSYDLVFFIALDARGRRVATFRNTDTLAKEVFYHHTDGASGPLCGGGVIMRERSQDLIDDPSNWATKEGDWEGHRDQFCTDFAGNIIALVDDLVEQYRYSASGVPFGIPLGDLNADGVVDATTVDYKIWLDASSSYEVRADLDLDGDVDNDDEAIMISADGNTTGRGRFSVASVRNIKGFGGCELFGEGLHTLWACATFQDAGGNVSIQSRLLDYWRSTGLSLDGSPTPGCQLRDGTCVPLDTVPNNRRPFPPGVWPGFWGPDDTGLTDINEAKMQLCVWDGTPPQGAREQCLRCCDRSFEFGGIWYGRCARRCATETPSGPGNLSDPIVVPDFTYASCLGRQFSQPDLENEDDEEQPCKFKCETSAARARSCALAVQTWNIEHCPGRPGATTPDRAECVNAELEALRRAQQQIAATEESCKQRCDPRNRPR